MQGCSRFFAGQARASTARQLFRNRNDLEEIMTQERSYWKAEAHTWTAWNAVCQQSRPPRDRTSCGWPS